MRSKNIIILHLIIVSLLFFTTGSYRNWPYKVESDGKYYYQYLISIWDDGDLDFTNNYQTPALPFMHTEIDHYHFGEMINSQTNRPTNFFTIGPAILWSPFYIISYGLAQISNSLSLTAIPLNGWAQYFQYSVMYAAVVYAALTAILIFKILTPYFDRQIIIITLFLLFWSTNWIYYTIFEPSLSHTYDLFTLVLFVWLYHKATNQQTTGNYILAGLAAGLHVLIRTQNILTIAIFVIFHITRQFMQHQNVIKSIMQKYLWFSGAFLLALGPLLFSNRYIFGKILIVPQGNNFLDMTNPAFYGVLFSGRNGLFSHHPVLILGVLGLSLAIINHKTETDCLQDFLYPLILVFLVQLYLNASVADWWGGHAFGQRRLMSSLLLFGFGFGYIQKYWNSFAPKAKGVTIGVVALFTIANLYLVYIHIFLWSYDEPHNIIDWMFNTGPILTYIKYFS